MSLMEHQLKQLTNWMISRSIRDAACGYSKIINASCKTVSKTSHISRKTALAGSLLDTLVIGLHQLQTAFSIFNHKF